VSGDGRDALVSAAAAVALVVVGIVAGFIGLIEATALIEFGPAHLSVGALVSAVANCGLGLLAVWGLDSREAAALPALGWFAMLAVALFGPLPGGDILLPGSGWDVVSFVVAGAVGAAVAGGLGRRVTSPRTATASPEATSTSPETPLDR